MLCRQMHNIQAPCMWDLDPEDYGRPLTMGLAGIAFLKNKLLWVLVIWNWRLLIPNIIYLGTGENLKKPRNFTLPGTGMYRSDDAGKTWKHIGLEDSWSIAEIAIDP